MPDFFISYNKADREWAEWIAWQLEKDGFSTVLQAWDFGPGCNFVLEMQKAIEDSKRTIAVLSPDFLTSLFTRPEWAAAFVGDPTGEERKLLPVRVRECKPGGLLKALSYIDLVDLDEEAAKNALLAGVKLERAKPSSPPRFPSTHSTSPERPRPRFPVALPPESFPLIKTSDTQNNLLRPGRIGREKGNYVFICYARADENFAFKLAINLNNRGIPIWLDKWDIPNGADWDLAIDTALKGCAHFLIVLSPASANSDNVRSELLMAFDEEKHIVPILYQACNIPRRLRLIQYTDFSNYSPDDAAALNQVLHSLTPQKEIDQVPIDQIKQINISGHWRDNADGDEVFFVHKRNVAVGIYDLGEKRKIGYYIGQIKGYRYEYKWFWYDGECKGHGLMLFVHDCLPILSGRYWDEDDETGDVQYEYIDNQMPKWLSEIDFDELLKIADKMDRKMVVSSNLKSIGYDQSSNILEIEFLSGEIYQYFDIPSDIHLALMSHASKGKYFYKTIEGKYKYKRIN